MDAYICGFHNPLNYDLQIIDLNEDDKKYYALNVCTNIANYYENDKLCSCTTYRCRLRGIENIKKKSEQKNNTIFRELVSRLYKYDGYVKVFIHKIDKYKRLIVDIFDLDGNNIYDTIIKDTDHFKTFDSY